MFYYNVIYSDNTRYCFYTLYYASFKKNVLYFTRLYYTLLCHFIIN